MTDDDKIFIEGPTTFNRPLRVEGIKNILQRIEDLIYITAQRK
jgi:hypothetical protein|tara:strand:- start:492 stop:620 length:129 start_codon:yes stop_codon:yes gene_type:complete